MTPPDPDTPSTSRRPLLIATVGIAVVAALVTAFWLRDDPSERTATSSADATTSTNDANRPAAPGDEDDTTPTADGGPDAADGDLPVELTPVSGEGEAELCAAIVTRLEEYRDAGSNGLPSQELVDALNEFEAQVDTQSDDQDWGDRIIEQTTNVRREWVTALTAERDGDSAAANDHNATAVEYLDQAIDGAACPTA